MSPRIPALELLLCAILCGACAATPMPEPPAAQVDLSRVSRGDGSGGVVGPGDRVQFVFVGSRRAAPPNATIYATNLDDVTESVATTANADGSFSLTVPVEEGDEVRFQVARDGERGMPVDARITNAEPTPVERPECIVLEPGLALEFADTGTASLTLHNTCSEPVTMSGLSARLSLEDFALETTLPVTVAPDERATFAFSFTPRDPGEREDVLFLSATRVGTDRVRYPISLHAVSP